MTFVGSTRVGKLVMKQVCCDGFLIFHTLPLARSLCFHSMRCAQASETLTPVVLELGGKDPFVLLPGANVDSLVDTAARGGWGAGGQNCIGAERFFVHASLVDRFVARLTSIAQSMRQGPPLNASGNTGVDIGALCLPGEATRIQALVDDAKAHGAQVLTGGRAANLPGAERGQFYPPTLILVPDAKQDPSSTKMRLLKEEVFGPLITVIPFEHEDDLVAQINGCSFALGSSVFGRSDREVVRVGRRLDAGMLACNDFATCYMCQSLPMGGLKDSGFGKFAGVEGLRGLCIAKAVVEDLVPFVRTQLPPPLRYPLSPVAFAFTRALMQFFYGHSLASKVSGIMNLAKCSLMPSSVQVAQTFKKSN